MSESARDLFDTVVMPKFEGGSNKDWIRLARDTARYLARLKGFVTVNDVRKECPPPPGADPRIMGAIFRKTEFRKVGEINSDRRQCHGRPVARFVLVEAK